MTEQKTLTEIAVENGFDVKRIYNHIKASLADQNLSPEAFDKVVYRMLSRAVYPDLHQGENHYRALHAFQEVNEQYNPENKKPGVSALFKKKERVVVPEKKPVQEDPLQVELKKLLRKKNDYLARAESSAIADTNRDFQHYITQLASVPDAQKFLTDALAYEQKATDLIELINARVGKNGSSLRQEDLRPVYNEFYPDPAALAARMELELKARKLIEDYQQQPHRLQTTAYFRLTMSQADLEPLRSTIEENIQAHKAFTALPRENYPGEAEALNTLIAKEVSARRAYLPVRMNIKTNTPKYDGVFEEFTRKNVHVDFLKTLLQVEHELTNIARITHERHNLLDYKKTEDNLSAEFEKIREAIDASRDPVNLVAQFKELQTLKLEFVAQGNTPEGKRQRAVDIKTFASPSSLKETSEHPPAELIEVMESLLEGRKQRPKSTPKSSWQR